MAVTQSIGTKLRVSATLPATFDTAGYTALTFTDVGEFTAIPEHGGKADLVIHIPLASGYKEKFHGAIDAGSVAIAIAWDVADAGQVILRTAWTDRTEISFEIETPGGEFFHTTGRVLSDITRAFANNAVVGGNAQLEFNRDLNVS